MSIDKNEGQFQFSYREGYTPEITLFAFRDLDFINKAKDNSWINLDINKWQKNNNVMHEKILGKYFILIEIGYLLLT